MVKKKGKDKLPLGVIVVLIFVAIGIVFAGSLIFEGVKGLLNDPYPGEGLYNLMNIVGIFFSVLFMAYLFISGLFLYKKNNIGRILIIVLFSIVTFFSLPPAIIGNPLDDGFFPFFGRILLLAGGIFTVIYLSFSKKVKKIYS